MSDGVYGGSLAAGTATSIHLTTAWGINAGYEHFWSPQWRTSLYGGYAVWSYNGQANAILCSLQGSGNGLAGTAGAGWCGLRQQLDQWWIGSRTQWNVTKDFYMGLDVAYLKFDGMSYDDWPTANWYCQRHPSRHQPSLHARQQPGQLAGSLPRASRLLSLIA